MGATFGIARCVLLIYAASLEILTMFAALSGRYSVV